MDNVNIKGPSIILSEDHVHFTGDAPELISLLGAGVMALDDTFKKAKSQAGQASLQFMLEICQKELGRLEKAIPKNS